MADYRLSASVISRGKGQSSIASASYRSASRLVDERTGEIHDYTRKGGLLHAEILAPDNAPSWMHNRAELWNAVETIEKRKDAQLAREVQISLPHELTDDQRLELARSFVQEQFVNRGMVADVAIHAPGRNGDDRNHHAHVMLTMRELTGDGFGKKVRDWNSPDLLTGWREQWAHHQNRALERHGHAARVDHRSYEAQGVDRSPSQHLGPTAHKMELAGKPSRIGDENRAISADNDNRADLHREAVIVSLDIERQKRSFDKWAQRQQLDLQKMQAADRAQLDQKEHQQRATLHKRHEQIYGQAKATLHRQLAVIDGRLNVGIIGRVLGTLSGSRARDSRQRENIMGTLAQIVTHQNDQTKTLENRQDLARREITRQQIQRQKDLKAGIDRARVRREQAGWRQDHVRPTDTPRPATRPPQAKKPAPTSTPKPAPTVSRPWERAASNTNKRPWERDSSRAASPTRARKPPTPKR